VKVMPGFLSKALHPKKPRAKRRGGKRKRTPSKEFLAEFDRIRGSTKHPEVSFRPKGPVQPLGSGRISFMHPEGMEVKKHARLPY